MTRKLILIPILLMAAIGSLAADYYWVGGQGHWSDLNHWANTSGGSLNYLNVPGPADNVIFDQNSFSGPNDTVWLPNGIATCRDFDWSAITTQPVLRAQGSTSLRIYGSMRLNRAMTMPLCPIHFEATTAGHVIDTDSIPIYGKVYFDGIGGEWSLNSALFGNALDIYLLNGSFNTQGYPLSFRDLSSEDPNPRSFLADNSLITVGGHVTFNATNLSVSALQDTFLMLADFAQFKVTGTGNPTFHDITFANQNGVLNCSGAAFHNIRFQHKAAVSGTIQFNELDMRSDGTITGQLSGSIVRCTPGSSYELMTSSNIQVSDSLVAQADCFSYIEFFSSGGAGIVKGTGILEVSFVSLNNIHAIGGASFLASNSLDLGGNTGWTIVAPPAAAHYWVNGQGNWHDRNHWSYSSGGSGGACIPTPADDVVFDNNSFTADDTVFLDAGLAFCHDMLWLPMGDTPVFLMNEGLFIYGSLTLIPVMEVRQNTLLTFKSGHAGNTITTAGHVLDNHILFNGQGGAWTLLDSLSLSGDINFREGDLNTNDQAVNCHAFTSDWQHTRILSLGKSIIDLDADSATAWAMRTPNLSLNAGTSHIRVNGNGASFTMLGPSPQIYHDLSYTDPAATGMLSLNSGQMNRLWMHGNGLMKSANYQFDSIVLSPGKAYRLTGGSGFVLNELVAPGSCQAPIVLRSDSSGHSSTLNNTGSGINCTHLVLQDIHATGNIPFMAQSSDDLGNNPGWVFTPPQGQDLYWVGGTGNWSDTAHWSYSSGGPGGACIPRPGDDVFFDQNSGSNNSQVHVDLLEANCRNMTWDGLADTMVLMGPEPGSLHIFGSLAFDTLTLNASLLRTFFESDLPARTIRTEGVQFNHDVTFCGDGGWMLEDSFKVHPGRRLIHESGDLLSQGNAIGTGYFFSNTLLPRSIDIRKSAVTVQQAWSVGGDSLGVFLADSSRITFTGPHAKFRNERGILPYHYLVAIGELDLAQADALVTLKRAELLSSATFTGSHHYDTLIITPGNTYTFSETDTQFVDIMEAQASCFQPIILQSSGLLPAYLHKANGTLSASGLVINDIHAIGGAFFLASSSSSNGNSSGWNIVPIPPRDLYWVGGTGQWSDASHWSLSSGGTGGECLPRLSDNVFFDHLSFINPDDTVTVDSAQAFCRNMTWTAPNDTPCFISVKGGEVFIAGSLLLNTSMDYKFNDRWHFVNDSLNATIDANGNAFLDTLLFDGSGSWTLLSDLDAPGVTVFFNRGSLHSSGHTLRARRLYSFTTDQRVIDLSNSSIYLSDVWRVRSTNLQFSASQSDIFMQGSSALMYNAGTAPLAFGGVEFSGGGTARLQAVGLVPTFRKVAFSPDAMVLGEHVYDTLVLSPGKEYRLEMGLVQKVNSLLMARGNNCYPITLHSTLQGTQARIRKNTGTVSADFLHLRDIDAFGGATFYAGGNSTDVANNSGWVFANNPGYVFGLGDDTTITLGDTITLSTVNFNGGPYTTYIWSDGSTGSTLDVTYPGMYFITVTYAGGCSVVDSIDIGCAVNIDFITKPVTCYGGSDGSLMAIPLDTSLSYTFSWSNGGSGAFIQNLGTGYYVVSVLGSNGCRGKDTAYVDQPPRIVLPLADTAYCRGDSLLADAGPGFATYAWSTADTTQAVWIDQAGSYYGLVTDVKGCVSDTFRFDVREDTLPVFELGPDTTLCLGHILFINAGSAYDAYTWQDGFVGTIYTAYHAGTYTVEVRNGTCLASDSLTIGDCPPWLRFPNVFTPNADGYNDAFGPEAQNISHYEMLIFDRWGALVFKANAVNETWDGRYHRQECSEGVYYYVVSYREYGSLGEPGTLQQRGTVTLLR